MPQAEIVIVGGGVIGLSLAWELAEQGRDVLVVERGEPGREASWAGAGMLPPGNLAHALPGCAQLRALSHRLWPEWSARLLDETGIDNGYDPCGGLTLSFEQDSCRPFAKNWLREEVELQMLDSATIGRLDPLISSDVDEGFLLPGLSQVRNPRHLAALKSMCVRRGVQLVGGSEVVEIEIVSQQIASLQTTLDRITGDRFCFCSGAWTSSLLERIGRSLSIEPVRGQIVLLRMGTRRLKHVIEVGDRYLVPRQDGRVLVGSTMERVGFCKQTTVRGISDLLDFACELVPAFADATIEQTWAGLRPGSPDGTPFLGMIPGYENAFVGAGHFRNGLQMSPGTAVLLRQIILGEATVIDADPFDPATQAGVVS